jgi:ferredoxin
MSDSPDDIEVRFLATGTAIRWLESYESLLSCAESAGIHPPFSCRSGVCGTCVTRMTAGSVTYSSEPLVDLTPGEILLCCSRPAESVTLAL